MKITLVSPPFGEGGQKSKGLPIAPPVIEYLAGLTYKVRPHVDVTLIDANLQGFNPDEIDTDLVGFTVLTPQSPWVYRMSKKLRDRNIPVILGGIHVNALPQEAVKNATTILLGEAEQVWPEILDDARNGQLKSIYNGCLSSLHNLPHPITDLLPGKYVFGSFFTSRGCPHNCSFCSVHTVYGNQLRTRPIKDVVTEVAGSQRRLFWNLDDNIWGAGVRRSTELFREMGSNIKGKWWFGSGDLVTVQNRGSEEMLKWGRRAGLTSVMVGWESNNINSLREYKAVVKQGNDRVEAIKKIRSQGIDVMLFIMVGGRQDSYQEYERVLELCDKLNISAHPVMTTPFPGTGLYEEYKPFLISGFDWDKYNGNTAVFLHDEPDMSALRREQAIIQLRANIFTWPRIIKRLTEISVLGFPKAHLTSFMVQFAQGRAFKQFAKAARVE